ncbi:hypothetical protein MARBORIA2_19010 [Methanobrevibacter arboriphilus]|uniref:Uncharacterized protein n=1 Tax=Methanobrevibacter arboriphilus TaxID=39441 RepID=A0ACA8R1K2_METAZ|nr:hypothetical protein MarbSA_00340 [Methanobrevibacter arboriphilus]GLI12811.1 hypothetical protein MARBORIA2_19010 [Methanobrevibacter arboriphilus]
MPANFKSFSVESEIEFTLSRAVHPLKYNIIHSPYSQDIKIINNYKNNYKSIKNSRKINY